MSSKRSICVYCGSKNGHDVTLLNTAFDVGKQLALSGYNIIYGGANVGLMGHVANGALEAKGSVIGIMPKVIFDFEVSHNHLTELITVDSMHERKLKMMEMSDAFIALPGGFGTHDELNEIITWRQIKLHDKPIAILNHNGYYDHFILFLKTCVKTGLISQEHIDMLIVERTIEEILARL
ncbi:MAG: TIGR00730 family Rossman fold protein [Pseudobdellovibrio sp.]